ncbi:GH92 family glycosyl hydrolase [Marinoscillum sp.]|uniref:GH92 family glycosyl hydrolase n=1 Tax=Marinoscillum sp. TaxID=2024838 RepID=UPI003BAC4E9A
MKLLRLAMFICIAGIALPSCQVLPEVEQPRQLTDYVNTFLGTEPLTDPDFIGYTPPKDWRVWAGLTYPGSALPNAMVQLSPITEYGSGAGYEYEDSVIYGFAHTNKGHWNLCHLPILPVRGSPNMGQNYGSKFTHEKESSAPGYYQVYLEDFGVNVQLTSTLRTGFHEYTFEKPEGRKVLFDLARSNHRVRDWTIYKVDDNHLSGVQVVGGDSIFFYASTNTKITSLEVTNEGARDGKAIVELENGDNPVELRIALSFTSLDNAKTNFEVEIGNKSFEEVRSEANNTWQNLLSGIEVNGGTERQKELFYSSLYRSFLWPSLRSDSNGDFRDITGEVQNKGHRYYTKPSLWDTYRNKLVLLTMLSPDVSLDVIKSLHNVGQITGFIPTFFHGDHAAPYITGAYLRGVRGFEVDSVYQLLLNNATKEGGTRPHIAEYIEKGYISTPRVDSPHVESKAKAGVSKTLEYAYDDYSLAILARELGDEATYRTMISRSENFQNVFDPSVNFMRGRLADGSWVQNFDPKYPYYEYMYREANAWQVSFFAPHNMPMLIELYGGSDAFESKLDSLFTVPWNPEHIARNVSSFIGQYCHGNQPDHEAPFSYYFINKPEKSQHVLDNILNNFYGVGEHGNALAGMDDAGEMSAWYVFAASGLYPFSAGDDEYLVSVPLFDSVKWAMPNGKQVQITQSGQSRDLKAIKVNDLAIDGYFISHELFQNGGYVEVITE